MKIKKGNVECYIENSTGSKENLKQLYDVINEIFKGNKQVFKK